MHEYSKAIVDRMQLLTRCFATNIEAKYNDDKVELLQIIFLSFNL